MIGTQLVEEPIAKLPTAGLLALQTCSEPSREPQPDLKIVRCLPTGSRCDVAVEQYPALQGKCLFLQIEQHLHVGDEGDCRRADDRLHGSMGDQHV